MYNIMYVSGVQHSDSQFYNNYNKSYTPFMFIMKYCYIPCAAQYVLVAYLFYTK